MLIESVSAAVGFGFVNSIVFGIGASASASAIAAQTPECIALDPDSPVIVTPDCIDPEYPGVTIDMESDQVSPVPHRKVSAHVDGTEITVNVYLPPKSAWEGRFFQMVYPTHEAEALDNTIAFAVDSGGYAVQISGTIGYRADAAAAKFSRAIAAEYYNEPSRRIYGYIYGGSGGSLQTVGAIENTFGVWDAAVPIIQAVPISFMNNPTVRCLSGLVLKDKGAQIAAAVRPGGGGDPYVGLTSLEKAMLEEATKMGIPVAAWEVFDAVVNSTTMDLLRVDVMNLDPTYSDDFWNEPGYLGSEHSELGDLLRSLKVEHVTTIVGIEPEQSGAIQITLDSVPVNPEQSGFDFTMYAANGTQLGPLKGSLSDAKILTVDTGTTEASVISALSEGLEVKIDNRWFIAMHAYYRHQVPSRDGFYGYDQFRDAHGQPIYPQRPIDTSAAISESTSGGGTHTGNITGKIIAVNNLLDYDAFPWHADWYRSEVNRSLGDKFDNNYRIWFNDNADHNFGPVPDRWVSRVIDFTGIYHQALQDLRDWVEEGISPPRSTEYTVSNVNQVVVPEHASTRFGIQPVVELTARSSETLTVGTPVIFDAHIEVPPNSGMIISTEWDLLGSGDFVSLPFGSASETVEAQANFTYSIAGSYIPALRVTAQREGNSTSPYRHVMNLGRVAIEVS